jgi:hypothetical protein
MGPFVYSVVACRLTQGNTGTCIFFKNVMPKEVEVEALFFQKSYPHLLLFCLVIFNGCSPDIMGENCDSFYTLEKPLRRALQELGPYSALPCVSLYLSKGCSLGFYQLQIVTMVNNDNYGNLDVCQPISQSLPVKRAERVRTPLEPLY